MGFIKKSFWGGLCLFSFNKEKTNSPAFFDLVARVLVCTGVVLGSKSENHWIKCKYSKLNDSREIKWFYWKSQKDCKAP